MQLNKTRKTILCKAVSVEITLFALHYLYSKCWTVKVVMEVTSLKLFTLSFQSLQGHFWHSVLYGFYKESVPLAEEPNWQTEISLFFNLSHSESSHVSACSLLYPWTPFRYNDHRTNWTGAVLMEHLLLQVIYESYLVNIKSETPQNDIHMEKYTKKTLSLV